MFFMELSIKKIKEEMKEVGEISYIFGLKE